MVIFVTVYVVPDHATATYYLLPTANYWGSTYSAVPAETSLRGEFEANRQRGPYSLKTFKKRLMRIDVTRFMQRCYGQKNDHHRWSHSAWLKVSLLEQIIICMHNQVYSK